MTSEQQSAVTSTALIIIDDKTYQLPQNNFGHSLHGDPQGWQYKVFKPNQLNDKAIKLTFFSPDGGANYPGNVTATVTYALIR